MFAWETSLRGSKSLPCYDGGGLSRPEASYSPRFSAPRPIYIYS